MKRIGTFTVDELGRVSISNELRSTLNWKTGEKLFVYHVDNKTAMLQPARVPLPDECDLCGNDVGIVEVKGNKICRICSKRIIQLSIPKL